MKEPIPGLADYTAKVNGEDRLTTFTNGKSLSIATVAANAVFPLHKPETCVNYISFRSVLVHVTAKYSGLCRTFLKVLQVDKSGGEHDHCFLLVQPFPSPPLVSEHAFHRMLACR